MPLSVLVCGAPVFDYGILLADHTEACGPPEREMLAFEVGLGGCAFNIAHNLRLLGQGPIMAATVGSDFEVGYRHSCARKGIDTSLVTPLPDGTRSATCVSIAVGSGISQTYYAKGPLIPEHAVARVLDQANFDIAVVAADRVENTLHWIEALSRLRRPFLFAPGPDVYRFSATDLRKAASAASLLHTNQQEWDYIEHTLQREPIGSDFPNTGAVVTNGSAGSRFITFYEDVECPAVEIETVVDGNGCGDAHLGGFVVALYNGWTPLQALQLGNVLASFCASMSGTQEHNPSLADIYSRARAAYGLDISEDELGLPG